MAGNSHCDMLSTGGEPRAPGSTHMHLIMHLIFVASHACSAVLCFLLPGMFMKAGPARRLDTQIIQLQNRMVRPSTAGWS